MIDVEPLIRTHLDRLAPLPDASTRDWADVLRRVHGSRRAVRALVLAAALVLLAAALLVAAPALGFRQVADVFGSEPTPSWTWPEGVPGDPIKPPKLIVSANQTANGRFGDPVDLGSVRQIVSVGRGYGRSEFLAARGLDGDVCLTKLTGHGSAGAPFNCLHDLPKPGVPPVDQQAVMIGMSAGGHRGRRWTNTCPAPGRAPGRRACISRTAQRSSTSSIAGSRCCGSPTTTYQRS